MSLSDRSEDIHKVLCEISEITSPHDKVQALPLVYLYVYIVLPPLGGDLLDHAASCNECASKISEARQHHLDSLSDEESQKIRDGAEQVLKRLRET